MSDNVSFRLFGAQGYLNTTPARFSMPFFDVDAGEFRQKQSREFDGGWRWYESLYTSTLVIYNVKLNPRASADLTKMDLENSRLQPETLLNFARAHVIMEHAFCTATDQLIDHIRAQFQKARIAIIKEIRGDDSPQPHLRTVR